MKEKTEGVLKKWDRYKYVALVVLAGIVLLLWPTNGGEKPEAGVARQQDDPLQQKLTTALETMEGVGRVRVVLTIECDGERLLAQDSETRYSGNSLTPENYQHTSEIVLRDGTGGSEPMVVRTVYPTYRGALIICEGGDKAEVRLAVTKAVQVLTGLSSDRISVAKWQ